MASHTGGTPQGPGTIGSGVDMGNQGGDALGFISAGRFQEGMMTQCGMLLSDARMQHHSQQVIDGVGVNKAGDQVFEHASAVRRFQEHIHAFHVTAVHGLFEGLSVVVRGIPHAHEDSDAGWVVEGTGRDDGLGSGGVINR
jgi:hypothetical protein